MPNTASPPTENIPEIVSTLKRHAPSVRDSTASHRKQKLRRLADALVANRDTFRSALDSDFRKARVEVDLTEIKAVTLEAEHAIKHLEDWMAPTPVSTPALFTGTTSTIRYEPKGVVLIMSPWNYPVNLTLGPLVAAIAAGNCVVLKPSEHAPNTADAISDLIGNLFDDREIRVVTGGPDVAEKLTRQPFDHIYFTGSPTIGRRVMKAAAEHLTSVTLELGGKSPALVDSTADLERSADRIVWTKFMNAGQTCIAPDYVLAERRIYDDFLDCIERGIRRMYGSSPAARQASADYPRLIHDDHFENVVGMMTDALSAGATARVGGQHDAETRYVEPTVLTDVPLDARVMQEEIFGPLLPIVPFRSLEQALSIMNDRPSPLSTFVFSERDRTVDTILQRTTAGSTCINEGPLHFLNPHLPFGGKGESGIGRGHGHAGFLEFSNERSVLRRKYGSDLFKLLYPPFDGFTNRLAAWILRYF